MVNRGRRRDRRSRSACSIHTRDEVRPLLVFRLKFAQPCRNSSEEVGLVAMRAAKLSAVARQTSEARCVQINSGVNYFAGHGAHKTQRGHHHSLAHYSTPTAWSLPVRCEGRTSNRSVRFSCATAPRRSVAIISAGLTFALSFGNPYRRRLMPLGRLYGPPCRASIDLCTSA